MTSKGTNERLVWALFGILAALPGVFGIWGYTVDDALISARVADNIAHGNGYRFNPSGPVVDAVTPLGWAYLLAVFAKQGAWSALSAARVVGTLAWLAAAGVLSARLVVLPARVRVMTLWVMAAALPLSAWAVSGMETPWVVLLATLAVTQRRSAPLWAGLAAAWRPELLGWAVTGAVLSQAGSLTLRVVARVALVVLVPSVVTASVRLVAFGDALPLALSAKPPDFGHGLRYALGALFLSGPPLLLFFFGSFRKLGRPIWAWAAAFAVHSLSLVFAGGDWMSFYRLAVPVLPGVLWVGGHLLEVAPLRAGLLRTVLALTGPALLWVYKSDDARAVVAQRRELIERARGPLEGARRVGTVDVGWVGAATDAAIFDFAGVTDPSIAVLVGGHTTKRIPRARLSDVDALVLLLDDGAKLGQPWFQSRFYYGVDRRVAVGASDLPFVPTAVIPLGGTEKRYVVLRRR